MATVKDTATGDVYEGVSGSLLDYYRGEGARFEIVDDELEQAATFPQVFVDGERIDVEPAPEQVEQLPEGEFVQGDGVEHEHLGTGEENVGVEVPLGESAEISNAPQHAADEQPEQA